MSFVSKSGVSKPVSEYNTFFSTIQAIFHPRAHLYVKLPDTGPRQLTVKIQPLLHLTALWCILVKVFTGVYN